MLAWLRDEAARVICNFGEMTGIGATGMVYRLCGKTIVQDWGVAISRKGEVQIQSTPAGNFLIGFVVDLIIITHKHLDHMGAVLRLITEHPESRVVISRKAFEGLKVMAVDSLKIMRNNLREAQRNGLSVPEEIFTQADLDSFSKEVELSDFEEKENTPDELRKSRVTIIDENCWLEWPDWPGWQLGFCSAGHDDGARSFILETPDGERIYATGDIASHDQEVPKGVMLPSEDFQGNFFDKPVVMVTEATNGAKRERSWSHNKVRHVVSSTDELDSQLERICQQVKSRGGVVQVATFAGNRSSEVLLKVVRMGHKAAVDGMARDMVKVEIGEEYVNQLVAEGKLIIVGDRYKGISSEDGEILIEAQREAIAKGEYGFVVVIAPSATLDQGYSVFYAERILPETKNALIIPGYLFPDSTSKQIMELDRGHTIKLNTFSRNKSGRGHHKEPKLVNTRCDVYHFEYTSHDLQGALVERVRLVKPQKLIVHHCDEATYPVFEEALRSALDYPLEVIRAEHFKEIEL